MRPTLAADATLPPPYARTAYQLHVSYALHGIDEISTSCRLAAISSLDANGPLSPPKWPWVEIKRGAAGQPSGSPLPDDAVAFGRTRLLEAAGQTVAFLARAVGAAASSCPPGNSNADGSRVRGWIKLQFRTGAGREPELVEAELALEVADAAGILHQAFRVTAPSSFPVDWIKLIEGDQEPDMVNLTVLFGPEARIRLARLAWWALRGDPDLSPELLDPD
jgi:hypothetical protein